MINGRNKGAKAELEVAKVCQDWWNGLPPSQQQTPDGKVSKFIRTPLSGGWSTRQTRANFRVAGDLSSTSLAWPFTVEVKRRESWSLSLFVKAGVKGSPAWLWWQQCVKASLEEGGVPMLWMRKNLQPWIVVMPEAIARPRLGLVNADIFWQDSGAIARHNKTGVHPIGYLASTVLASNPADWLGLRKEIREDSDSD